VKLTQLVQTSANLAETRSRARKTRLLADCLAAMEPGDVHAGVSYLAGSLPQGRIGVGPSVMRSVTTPAAPLASLSIAAVDRAFADVAGIQGAGAQRRRLERLQLLWAEATRAEQAFLRRLLLGELRQGALEGVAVDALALASGSDKAVVRKALMVNGVLAEVASAALSGDKGALHRMRLQLMRPVQPMLAQPAESPESALQPGETAVFEYKLDGARVQIHRDGDSVRVYTRQLHDVTERVPELVAVAKAMPSGRFILDGEAIAFAANGRPLPFQVTMKRFSQRRDVGKLSGCLPLSCRIFDCLHADGDDLLDVGLAQRLERIAGFVPPELQVRRQLIDDADVARRFLSEAIADGHEGIMIKSLASPYEAGSRGAAWLKVKPVHTLDLVVLGAEWGSGRRKGWLSNLHLGARDPDSGGFVMLGKTFKGMTDKILQWQTAQLLARETARDGNLVHVRPELVVEVAFNTLQRSRQYPAGLALRFARIRRYRDDKPAHMADTLETVEQIYAADLGGNPA
jgi:DNA ligase-1